jgi:hypothetical protein
MFVIACAFGRERPFKRPMMRQRIPRMTALIKCDRRQWVYSVEQLP